MLSIIISSYQQKFYSALEKNIAENCGVEYEIIKIDNPGMMGIAEAYNQGAEIAKFENLLFLHEDVMFKTINWGGKLLAYLNHENAGIIGLAGATKKFKMCYGYDSLIPEYGILFVQDQNGNTKNQLIWEKPIHVKTLDGVFLAMKKKIWKKLTFDEKIEGFHFYDVDISLRAAENYQNMIANDIELMHFSMGNFSNQWIKACISFNKKNYPAFDIPTKSERKRTRHFWYKRLKNENINFFNRLRYAANLGADRHSYPAMIEFLKKSK